MTTYTEKDNSGFHWLIAAILAALLLLLTFMGYGPFGSKCATNAVATTATTAATAATAAAPAAAVAVTPAPVAPVASVVAAAPAVESEITTKTFAAVAGVPAAKVYFGLDKTDLPADVQKTLGKVVTYLKANADTKAQISGFHDPQGDKAHNEELALNRARAVRGALADAGIPKERVAMQKPMETTGTGSNKEARRVEVSVVK